MFGFWRILTLPALNNSVKTLYACVGKHIRNVQAVLFNSYWILFILRCIYHAIQVGWSLVNWLMWGKVSDLVRWDFLQKCYLLREKLETERKVRCYRWLKIKSALVQMWLRQVFIHPLRFKVLLNSLYQRVMAVIPICSMREYCCVLTFYESQV